MVSLGLQIRSIKSLSYLTELVSTSFRPREHPREGIKEQLRERVLLRKLKQNQRTGNYCSQKLGRRLYPILGQLTKRAHRGEEKKLDTASMPLGDSRTWRSRREQSLGPSTSLRKGQGSNTRLRAERADILGQSNWAPS